MKKNTSKFMETTYTISGEEVAELIISNAKMVLAYYQTRLELKVCRKISNSSIDIRKKMVSVESWLNLLVVVPQKIPAR